MVVEEEVGLLLVDVEPQVAEVTRLERLDHGRSVDESAAARVDQHRPSLHPRERGRVDEVPRRGFERTVERDDVGSGQQFVERRIGDATASQFGFGSRVECQHAAAEAEHDLGHAAADPSGANHADRSPEEVEAEQTIQGKIALADPVVGLVQPAVEREHKADRVFRDRVRRILRHTDDRQRKPRGRRQIDLIEAGAAERDQLHALMSKDVERGGIELIVHEAVDGCGPLGQPGRVAVEPRFEPVPFDRQAGRSRSERGTVVGFHGKDGDTHGRGSCDVLMGDPSSLRQEPSTLPKTAVS